MNKQKTVSIWAPLRYANYGDDLQAIALGLMIKEMGYKTKLFQLDESLSRLYGLQSVSTVDELCKDSNICIIAGGALLTPFNIVKRMVHRAAIEYEQDFKDLLKASKKYPIKFCAISIGGDGLTHTPWKVYSHNRIKFFKSNQFLNGTVRLLGDVAQMKKFGKHFTYYPDMLFQTPNIFEYSKLPETHKYRVGINFKKGKYLDKELIHDIISYAQTHDDIEFHFTTTHLDKVGLDYQYLPPTSFTNIFIDKYESPRQLLGVMASMDIFITSMLHLGLTGLTVGTPFISYRGPGKTKSFLKSIGGEWAIVNNKISFNELKQNYFSMSKSQLFAKYNRDSIERMTKESLRHYEFCQAIIEKYA